MMKPNKPNFSPKALRHAAQAAPKKRAARHLCRIVTHLNPTQLRYALRKLRLGAAVNVHASALHIDKQGQVVLTGGTDIPPPELTTGELLMFGVVVPCVFVILHYLAFDLGAEPVVQAQAPIKVSPPPLAKAPVSQDASTPFEPSLSGGLNCGNDLFAPFPAPLLDAAYAHLKKTCEYAYSCVSYTVGYLTQDQGPYCPPTRPTHPTVLRGYLPKPQWNNSDLLAGLDLWPNLRYPEDVFPQLSAPCPMDDFLFFWYQAPVAPNSTFCVEVLLRCALGFAAMLSWYAIYRKRALRAGATPAPRTRLYFIVKRLGITLALAGVGFCCAPLSQLIPNPWPLLKLQSSLGLVLAILAMLCTLAIYFKLAGLQKATSLRRALRLCMPAAACALLGLARILNVHECYQVRLEQAYLDLSMTPHSYVEYVPGVCSNGLLIERWWYRAFLVVTRGPVATKARTYATEYFWYVRPAEEYATQAATQSTPTTGAGLLERALTWAYDTVASTLRTLDGGILDRTSLHQEWSRLWTNTKSKPAAGWESAVSLDDLAGTSPLCTYKSVAGATDPFSSQPLRDHSSFASLRYCSCEEELAATLDFRQKVQSFASAAPEELFPGGITAAANGLYHAISIDTVFMYSTLLWTAPMLVLYLAVGAAGHSAILFCYFCGHRTVAGAMTEHTLEQTKLNADLRESFVSVMWEEGVTSLNYDKILQEHPPLRQLESLVPMHATPVRKYNLKLNTGASSLDTPLPGSMGQRFIDLEAMVGVLATPGAVWILAITAVTAGLVLAKKRWLPLLQSKIKKGR